MVQACASGGRNLKLTLCGSYDSAVFELKTCEGY